MKNNKLIWKLQEDILDKTDINNLQHFIETTKRFTQFDKVREFENAWNKWQGSKFCIYVNSGSSANLLLVAAMKDLYNWKNGDEIIVPAVTWVTNISPVMQLGLKPVFVDINLTDLSFDYDKIIDKMSSRTKAIFITHVLGFPANMKKLNKIVRGTNIHLLEDSCESHGATIGKNKVGSIGMGGTFSFYWGHHMTTVEGGIICTQDEELYKLCVLKRSHGLARELPEKYHQHYKDLYPNMNFEFLFLTDGFNVRNTELHAEIGISQLKKLDKYIEIRKQNYDTFYSLCKKYENDLILLKVAGTSSFALPFIFKDSQKKNDFQKYLTQNGIQSRPLISGNLLNQPFLKKYKEKEVFPNAQIIEENGFYIGNNQYVNRKRLSYLGKLMHNFFKGDKN